MAQKQRKQHYSSDFDLDILEQDSDLFRWFLLCYLFGKPIQSDVAIASWRNLTSGKIDTPWAIVSSPDHTIVKLLHKGGYTRYQHVTSYGLKVCMERLIDDYEGSLYYMIESSLNEEEFSKRLQKLHGVGPKVAEIFMRETEEIFARRSE